MNNYTSYEIAQILCEMTYDNCNDRDKRFLKAKAGIEMLINDPAYKELAEVLQDFANVNEGFLK